MEQTQGAKPNQDEMPDAVYDEELEQLSKEVEEENVGLNTKFVIHAILLAIAAVILLLIILGVFGFLSQLEYGGL